MSTTSVEQGVRVQTKRLSAALAAAVVAIATLGACSSSGTDTQASATTSATPPSATSPSTPAADAHNDADVTFAQQMIPHHQQAVEMSDMLLAKQGIDPQVVSLANQIKAAQAPEIAQMQGWLSQWGVSTTTTSSPGNAMPSMPGHDMSGSGDMPNMGGGHGMMSEQDMAALQNAQGVEASRLFLSQMIQHHKGAITMAQTEIDSGQFPPAITLAHSIVTSQQQEITTMQGMLDAL
jgi:uncharacterized protein (DUF305 family)